MNCAESNSSDRLIAITKTIGFLSGSGVIVALDRFNLEDVSQSVSIYKSGPDMAALLASGARSSSELERLFKHLSGVRNLLVNFHLTQGGTEETLFLSIDRQTGDLVADAFAKSLGLSSAESQILLANVLSGIANLPEIGSRAISLNKACVNVGILPGE